MSEPSYIITPPATKVATPKPKPQPRRVAKAHGYKVQMGEPKDPAYNMQFLFNMRAPSGRIFEGFNAEQVRIQKALGWELVE